jgi:hypothetical protein
MPDNMDALKKIIKILILSNTLFFLACFIDVLIQISPNIFHLHRDDSRLDIGFPFTMFEQFIVQCDVHRSWFVGKIVWNEMFFILISVFVMNFPFTKLFSKK